MISAEAGVRLLERLKIPTSPDTLLCLIRRMKAQVSTKALVMGIDDWALRKGTTYATIIVDLLQRRVIKNLARYDESG